MALLLDLSVPVSIFLYLRTLSSEVSCNAFCRRFNHLNLRYMNENELARSIAGDNVLAQSIDEFGKYFETEAFTYHT